jgi:hypothetical protein
LKTIKAAHFILTVSFALLCAGLTLAVSFSKRYFQIYLHGKPLPVLTEVCLNFAWTLWLLGGVAGDVP